MFKLQQLLHISFHLNRYRESKIKTQNGKVKKYISHKGRTHFVMKEYNYNTLKLNEDCRESQILR